MLNLNNSEPCNMACNMEFRMYGSELVTCNHAHALASLNLGLEMRSFDICLDETFPDNCSLFK